MRSLLPNRNSNASIASLSDSRLQPSWRSDAHTLSNAKKRRTMALQPTAPRVTVAAILIRASLVRSWRCLTSVASLFVPPSQLPRRAPQSLSLSR